MTCFLKSVTGNTLVFSKVLPKNGLYILIKLINRIVILVTLFLNIHTYIVFYIKYRFNDMFNNVNSLNRFDTVLLVHCVYVNMVLPVTEPQKSIKNQTTL